jgi:integrase
MPKKAKELSARELDRLTCAIGKDGKPYNTFHPVGRVSGLLLQVAPTGAKSWILRTVVGVMIDDNGQIKLDKKGNKVPKRSAIGLGGYPDVSLKDARLKAQEAKEKIAKGINPVEERKAARRSLIAAQLSTMTFADAMRDYIKMKSKEFKNPRQEQQWTNSLASYALPHIGKVPVRDIELPHIKAVLDPIWETKTETANRVRARMENILGWCAVHGYRSAENPAKWQGYLDEVYPSPEKIKKKGHHAALSVDALPAFFTDLQKRTGTAARAMEFMILTASRTNEVVGDKRTGKAGITWQEIDFKKKEWTVPADRMKSGKAHKVPLTDAAMGLINSMEPGAPDALLFAGPKGDIPSNNFLSALLKRMDQPVTAHGFRSTFKDWAREHTAYADEVSELALAHVNSDATRAAYARSELLDKRRQLMGDWEQYCYHGKAQDAAKVVQIGVAR